jgi:hypothetical protein
MHQEINTDFNICAILVLFVELTRHSENCRTVATIEKKLMNPQNSTHPLTERSNWAALQHGLARTRASLKWLALEHSQLGIPLNGLMHDHPKQW